MTQQATNSSRRGFLAGAGGAAALALTPGLGRTARAAAPFKIGLFIPLSGPASLFGATDKACAQMAADEINAAGGILGRQIELLPTDAGVPPAEAAKSAVRLLLAEKVDVMVGSHDSAVREALESTVKGKVPYIYTPVYEGGACASNTYYLGETPTQQGRALFDTVLKEHGAKTFYLVGDDYVWPREVNAQLKKMIAAGGGSVTAEEYVPFGAANHFEEIVTRIKSAKPQVVLITLVGSDNVNFNRTFAGFGLHKSIMRAGFLLEENTLKGIGAESSANMYSAMGYFANVTTEANQKYKAAYAAKFGANAPQLGTIGVDSYAGIQCVKALVEKAGGTDPRKCMAASEGLRFKTASGSATLVGRRVNRDMYVAECKGTQVAIVSTLKDVKSGSLCAT